MSATGHQRRRRNAALKAAQEAAELGPEQPEAVIAAEQEQDAANEAQDSQAAELTPDDMNVETLRNALDELGVKYAHNTGEDKLRERLHNEINKP